MNYLFVRNYKTAAFPRREEGRVGGGEPRGYPYIYLYRRVAAMKCRDLYHLLLGTLAEWYSLTHFSLTHIQWIIFIFHDIVPQMPCLMQELRVLYE